MNAKAFGLCLVLCVGCSERSIEQRTAAEVGEVRSEAIGVIDAGARSTQQECDSAAPEPDADQFQTGSRLPNRRVVGLITDQDLELEEENPMLGELPGIGRFGARARLTLSEVVEGKPRADLSLTGTSSNGQGVGFSVGLSPSQARDLVGGQQVHFDGTSGVRYGVTTMEVVQTLMSARMAILESGLVTIRFELGDEVIRDRGTPEHLGSAAEFLVSGSLIVECLVPGSDGLRGRTLDDPRLETAFCQRMVKTYGLHPLTKLQ